MKEKNTKYIYISVVLVIALILNEAAYMLGRLIAHDLPHTDISLPLDLMMPMLPFTVILYFGSFLIWLIFYIIITGWDVTPDRHLTPESFFGTQDRGRFLTADALAKAICFLFFVFFPTTAIRPEITGDGVWDAMMLFLYRIDSADNLFPSLHCLISWLCWIGLRGRRDLHVIMRHLPLVTAILICLSTLTTKQHVILDVFGGIFLAELSWWIAGFGSVRKLYERPVGKLLEALTTHI